MLREKLRDYAADRGFRDGTPGGRASEEVTRGQEAM